MEADDTASLPDSLSFLCPLFRLSELLFTLFICSPLHFTFHEHFHSTTKSSRYFGFHLFFSMTFDTVDCTSVLEIFSALTLRLFYLPFLLVWSPWLCQLSFLCPPLKSSVFCSFLTQMLSLENLICYHGFNYCFQVSDSQIFHSSSGFRIALPPGHHRNNPQVSQT